MKYAVLASAVLCHFPLVSPVLSPPILSHVCLPLLSQQKPSSGWSTVDLLGAAASFWTLLFFFIRTASALWVQIWILLSITCRVTKHRKSLFLKERWKEGGAKSTFTEEMEQKACREANSHSLCTAQDRKVLQRVEHHWYPSPHYISSTEIYLNKVLTTSQGTDCICTLTGSESIYFYYIQTHRSHDFW